MNFDVSPYLINTRGISGKYLGFILCVTLERHDFCSVKELLVKTIIFSAGEYYGFLTGGRFITSNARVQHVQHIYLHVDFCRSRKYKRWS